jgi:hypothetical protein
LADACHILFCAGQEKLAANFSSPDFERFGRFLHNDKLVHMKPRFPHPSLRHASQRPALSGSARVVLLFCVAFLLGLGAGAWWIYRASQAKQETDDVRQILLSERTQDVLKHLDSAIEIRFYSLLNDPKVRETSGAFAVQVEQLLAEYERQGGGKIKFARLDSGTETVMKAASADGMTPFNLENGDACYLGIAFLNGDLKEQLPRLAPEWELAIEMDITRAIARVSAPAPRPITVAAAPVDKTVSSEVKQMIPDASAVSLDDGRLVIREAAAKEFMEAAKAMQAKVKTAEDRFTELSQNNASESELKAALEMVRKAQAEQAEKLNAIATRAQERITAFEQLKSGAR